eukprot:2238692-Lingulodinium_polyedra.AAC.1
MFPHQLDQDGLVHKLGGVLVAPGQPTCFSGNPSELDYFVVAPSLVPWIGAAEVMAEAPFKPHRPAVVRLNGVPRSLWAREPEGPRSFPMEVKPGCSRAPPDWESARKQLSAAGCDKGLSAAAGGLLQCIEQELCGRHDLVGPAARPYLGRAQAGRMKLVEAK